MATERIAYLEDSADQFYEFVTKCTELFEVMDSRIQALESKLNPAVPIEIDHSNMDLVAEKSNNPVLENLINLIKGGQA